MYAVHLTTLNFTDDGTSLIIFERYFYLVVLVSLLCYFLGVEHCLGLLHLLAMVGG
jgi:hypothetical protein